MFPDFKNLNLCAVLKILSRICFSLDWVLSEKNSQLFLFTYFCGQLRHLGPERTQEVGLVLNNYSFRVGGN
jgi:hypothetical protein